MNEDHLYENLPADPEQAFLLLEKYFREERDEKIAQLNREGQSSVIAYYSYIKKVRTVASEYGLEIGFDYEFPSIQNSNYEILQEFVGDIDSYVLRLKLRIGKRFQGYSVRFDATTKQKIRHHLSQIRVIVDILEVDQKKKETLIEKISALEQEVDRDRTRFDIYGAFVIEVAGVIGGATEKIEPLVDLISRLIWGAKEEEEAKQLPSPPERKQIEPPRPEDAFGDFGEGDENNPPDSEDKVPF